MSKNRKQNHKTPSTSDKTGISITRATLLTFVLCTVQAGPALAEVQMGDVTFPIQNFNTAQDSALTNNINVGLSSITLPAGGLEFTVDISREFSLDNPGGQFKDMGLPVMNHPKVLVQVEISQMAEATKGDLHFEDRFSDQEKQSFQLVDQISKADPVRTAVLMLGISGQTYSTARGSEWQAFLPGRTDSTYIAEIPAEETVHLKLCGKVAPDFYGQYQFTVHPTLKINAAR